jgi:hypothetical protein
MRKSDDGTHRSRHCPTSAKDAQAADAEVVKPEFGLSAAPTTGEVYCTVAVEVAQRMPTVKGIAGPHRFYFYSFDCNEPAHVHVQRQRMVCKFWIEPLALAQNHGFSA